MGLEEKIKPEVTKLSIYTSSGPAELNAHFTQAIREYNSQLLPFWKKNGKEISTLLYDGKIEEAKKLAGNTGLAQLLEGMYEWAKHLKDPKHQEARDKVASATMDKNDLSGNKIFRESHDHIEEDIKQFGLDRTITTVAFFAASHDSLKAKTGFTDKQVAEKLDGWMLQKALAAGFDAAAVTATAAYFDQNFGSNLASDFIGLTARLNAERDAARFQQAFAIQQLLAIDELIKEIVRAEEKRKVEKKEDVVRAEEKRKVEKKEDVAREESREQRQEREQKERRERSLFKEASSVVKIEKDFVKDKNLFVPEIIKTPAFQELFSKYREQELGTILKSSVPKRVEDIQAVISPGEGNANLRLSSFSVDLKLALVKAYKRALNEYYTQIPD